MTHSCGRAESMAVDGESVTYALPTRARDQRMISRGVFRFWTDLSSSARASQNRDAGRGSHIEKCVTRATETPREHVENVPNA